MGIRAVIFDFGGVILTSPFEAFAATSVTTGCPTGSCDRSTPPIPTRTPGPGSSATRSTGPASPTCTRPRRAAGHEIDGRAVLALLAGEIRPQMVEASAAATTG